MVRQQRFTITRRVAGDYLVKVTLFDDALTVRVVYEPDRKWKYIPAEKWNLFSGVGYEHDVSRTEGINRRRWPWDPPPETLGEQVERVVRGALDDVRARRATREAEELTVELVLDRLGGETA